MATAATAADAREREAAATVAVYPPLPFVPVAAEGCEIVTSDGRRILDFYGGHAVAALGYSHPGLADAISTQARTLLFQSNAVALDVRARAAEKLVAVAPAGIERAFFVNSGAEANDNALRMALVATGRPRVVAVEHGFHGRTAAAAAVTWGAERWYGFPRKPFDVDFVPRNDIAAAERLIDADVAAVIVEPVQGVAGAVDLDATFLQALRRLTRRQGALLIADEVQSGVGRCGTWFAIEAAAVAPDIITCAKALGGGIPCGAVLVGSELAAQFGAGSLGSTFGGGPVAAAAIASVLDAIADENLLANVRAREAQVRAECVQGPVTRVQGRGLLLGLVVDGSAAELRDALLERDILIGTSADPNVLRILAPLNIDEHHVRRLADAITAIA